MSSAPASRATKPKSQRQRQKGRSKYEYPPLTEHAQPVVDGDDDDVAVAGQDTSVEHVARALHVGAPVDEDHDGLGAAALPDVCRRLEAEGRIRQQIQADSHRCSFNSAGGFSRLLMRMLLAHWLLKKL